MANRTLKSSDPGRQTAVICTLGPGSRSIETIRQLAQSGMDVARLHFSYGDQKEHAENIRRIRQVEEEEGRKIGILQDLCGTKTRMGDFADEQVELQEGGHFTLTGRDVAGDSSIASINIPELISVAEEQDVVLLNDGALRLKVESIGDDGLHCRVERGGTVKSRQAIHIPGKAAPISVPTGKDRDDTVFGLKRGVDWVALSYACSVDEVRDLKSLIKGQGGDAGIVIKIERRQALENLEEMVNESDAVMVARGDLGLEIPIEEIGLAQKHIIRTARESGKPAITATEMLISMMDQPKPVRAEVTDITNAILDGSDAVMLSGETAVGQFPLEALNTMIRIVETTEASMNRSGTNRRECKWTSGHSR